MRKEIQRFAESMERRLAANEWKGGREQYDLFSLLGRLYDECKELASEIGRCSGRPATTWRASRIEREAADAANFAMMIADRAKQIAARGKR